MTLVLHRLPHTVAEAEQMTAVVNEVLHDAEHHHNQALVQSCRDELAELATAQAALPEQRQP